MRHRILLLSLATALVAVPLAAETFTVTLKNGATFLSRYQPREASWDAGKIVVLTEWGNSIALAKESIESIAAEIESRGFGRVINSTTIELGVAPNDAPDPNAEQQPAANTPAGVLQALQQMQTIQQPVYNMEQFVEPDQVTGVPVSWAQYNTTPPVSGVVITNPPPQP